ncbi:hypothetical protein BST81_17030 [Leptolyngbya sp. 'hensonii']|nr:hypothetical protein BST81_17030 [Leptolyngbya sp. 'hensonii']
MIRLAAFLDFLAKVLQARWRSLLVLLFGVGFPVLVFEQLAVAVWQYQGGFPWDGPLLLALHSTTQSQLDTLALILTRLGSVWTLWPLALGLALLLLGLRRWRSLAYLLVALSGNMAINRIGKAFWHRVRPHLWESMTPETDYAFPSGHAMTSMAIVAILAVLLWPSRWRWPILLIGTVYVITIGWTRLYLGVHFPSDILAGWMAALAWSIGTSLMIRPHLTQFQALDEDSLTADEEELLSN